MKFDETSKSKKAKLIRSFVVILLSAFLVLFCMYMLMNGQDLQGRHQFGFSIAIPMAILAVLFEIKRIWSVIRD